MRVVHIGHVWMRVPQRLVLVPMAVFTQGHRVMRMRVVPIVVAVRMFVLQRFMDVLVAV